MCRFRPNGSMKRCGNWIECCKLTTQFFGFLPAFRRFQCYETIEGTGQKQLDQFTLSGYYLLDLILNTMDKKPQFVIDSTLNNLKQYLLQDDNTCFGLIFGSHARGRTRPDSDLDLALYFRDPPRGLTLLDMINTLSNIAHKEVDLVVLNRASAFLRHQIIKEGIRFFIKDSVAYRRFREKTMIDFDIYRYIKGLYPYD